MLETWGRRGTTSREVKPIREEGEVDLASYFPPNNSVIVPPVIGDARGYRQRHESGVPIERR
jgi:hypothetical protein